MTTNWLPVPGFVGYYAASDAGEIMSMNYRRSGLPGVLTPRVNKDGYHEVQMYARGRKKRTFVHRIVAATFFGERGPEHTVNHINGIKTDNRVANLEYCPIGENIRKGHEIGLYRNVRGTNSGNAKLNDEKVREIRRLLKLKFSQKEVAELTGTTQGTVSLINTRRTWAHVEDEVAA